MLAFIFVHGLSGWGSYDPAYRRMPYWGMRGGDLIAWLRGQGFSCYAASVAPTGSAWDRACELYAQLAGTRVDYGASHSSRNRHPRFGRDFSAEPLIPSWDAGTKLVLIGHSFGGATVRLFSELLTHGCDEERSGGDPSAFFLGGQGGRIHALVTVASPLNGTTAYDLFGDRSFDPDAVSVPWWSKKLSRLMGKGVKPQMDGRDPNDYAAYDMHIDSALALNRRMPALPDVYCFSVPCSITREQSDGTHRPSGPIEPLFMQRSCQIGCWTGKTAGGHEIDSRWLENDGLVNTFSARAPLDAPQKDLDPDCITPGIWNVLPVYRGDHMALQGGLMHRHDVRPFYLDLLQMISRTVLRA